MKKIILSGGGTLGPVMPLLAVVEAYRVAHPETQFLWVGTPDGPERGVVEKAGISFVVIGGGKLRRYFSWQNFLDIFRTLGALFQSIKIIVREKPDLLISCGGFTSVPLHWAGALLRVPSWVHQQDVRAGLANKLMFPFATKITTALQGGVKGANVEWIGNPARDLRVSDNSSSRAFFGIPDGVPVILAMGGGTGSESINAMVVAALPLLPKHWHVIHLVGKERSKDLSYKIAEAYPNYHMYPFLTDRMKDAYAVADVVIARAGFSTLTELAMLKKAAIIVPIFGTHQEDNAKQFADNQGVISIKKGEDTGEHLVRLITDSIEQPENRRVLGERLHALLPQTKQDDVVRIIDSLS